MVAVCVHLERAPDGATVRDRLTVDPRFDDARRAGAIVPVERPPVVRTLQLPVATVADDATADPAIARASRRSAPER